ncbi:hypothetical protein [Aquitalea magnusonii]|uniref:hypothetical protein n=1 Tax=Aquitalea magnusonii TaxID=332411 RepID=UPI000D758E97|nr:hypothetical protein [Aquitalea magnusonii]
MDLISIPLSIVLQIAIAAGFFGAFLASVVPILLRWAEPWFYLVMYPIWWRIARRVVRRYYDSELKSQFKKICNSKCQ